MSSINGGSKPPSSEPTPPESKTPRLVPTARRESDTVSMSEADALDLTTPRIRPTLAKAHTAETAPPPLSGVIPSVPRRHSAPLDSSPGATAAAALRRANLPGRRFADVFEAFTDPKFQRTEESAVVAEKLLALATSDGRKQGLKAAYGEIIGDDGASIAFTAAHDAKVDLKKPLEHADLVRATTKFMTTSDDLREKMAGRQLMSVMFMRPEERSGSPFKLGGTRLRGFSENGTLNRFVVSPSEAYDNHGSPAVQERIARFYTNVLKAAGVTGEVEIEAGDPSCEALAQYMRRAMRA